MLTEQEMEEMEEYLLNYEVEGLLIKESML